MKPAPFEYFAPATVPEAVSVLQQFEGEAKVLAGGQSLVPLLNMRLARPQALVDLNRVAGLDYIGEDDGWLAIGALTRQRTLERSDVVQRAQPLLHAAVQLIAHPQIRNRGTIGGSLAHADPAAELPAAVLVLGGELRAASPSGERTMAAENFFLSYFTTALARDEVLTELRVPVLGSGTGWGFAEVARRHGDFALAGAAVTLTVRGGVCSDAAIALFGVGAVPVRAPRAEDALKGEAISGSALDEAAGTAAQEIDEPLSDLHASSDFRRHLARTMVRRALGDAARRGANGGSRG